MTEDKEKAKEAIKEVLTTSSFEYGSNINEKLISNKGGVNLSFGMRCFGWLTTSMIIILCLNAIGMNTRVKNSCKDMLGEIHNEINDYEESLDDRIKEEFNVFKDPLLVADLVSNPRKVLETLINVQEEDCKAYYINANKELVCVDKSGSVLTIGDSATYKELVSLLGKEGDIVESKDWYYEKTEHKYWKLKGYKIYNEDGSLNGLIAYSNAISDEIQMLTNIRLNTPEMSFYIFNKNKELIYSNDESEDSKEAMLKKMNIVNGQKNRVVWDSDEFEANKERENEIEESSKGERVNKSGFWIAQLAKNVGNGIKKVSVTGIISITSKNGYTVLLDYKQIVNPVIRNLIFFYVAAMTIALTVLYVLTYFYKYTKEHAKKMLKTVSWGIIGSIIVSIVFQMISLTISTRNLAKNQAIIIEEAIFTSVPSEKYLEYVSWVNHVNLSGDFEDQKEKLEKDFARYFEKYALENVTVKLITNPMHISKGMNDSIEQKGYYIKLRKSGGERHLDFEWLTKHRVKTRDIWFRVEGKIENNAQLELKKICSLFGDFDSFETKVGDQSFVLNQKSKYFYEQEGMNWDSVESLLNGTIKVIRTPITTRAKFDFSGFSYIVTYKNYDIAFIFLIVAVSMVIFIVMYFNIVFAIKNTDDEKGADNQYKHLVAEWLSGNITVINENEKDKESEYDEILLARLRKTNIERSKTVKTNVSSDFNDDDEDETYSRIKKEKDIFGISLFKNRRRVSEPSQEIFSETPTNDITELKDNVVSSIQNGESEEKEVLDVAKLKVTEERLAIKEVLDEIVEMKNVKQEDKKSEEKDNEKHEEMTFDEELELSSKDEKYDSKYDK